jgi:hypothetical protein
MRCRVGCIGVRLALVIGAWLAITPSGVVACSPPMEPWTIEDYGPDAVVIVGTTGEPAQGGRWFHVERWFNGGEPLPAIVIAFKEGPAIGDCSYPMESGRRLIIVPTPNEEGRLAADLGTLQADPTTPEGQAYLAEAQALFGPGVVPEAPPEEPVPLALDPGTAIALVVAAIGGIIGVLAFTGLPRRRAG